MADALLLERCVPGTRLRDALPEPERDVVVVGMLRRLWARADEARRDGARAEGAWPFRLLTEMCDEWADQFWRDYAAAPPPSRIDPGLARDGIVLFRELPRTAANSVLLCTDLHSENILAARRAPWLVIDPKPYIGDPAYDLLQHMINCEGRLPLGRGRAVRPDGRPGRRRSGADAAVAVRARRAGIGGGGYGACGADARGGGAARP
jgi:streptomycin 6-kinase